MGCRISDIAYYLPEQTLTNKDLKDIFPELELEKLEKIGIHSRRVATSDETASDLAYKAAMKLFENFNKDLIDFVLFCTQSPDYFLPTSACVIQNRLGLRKNIGALDFNLGCSGYVYGLSLAKGLIEGGIAKNVLLLTGETYSKFINKADRGNRSIFGDAGTATIISQSLKNGIFNFELGTDGHGANNLIIKNGGLRNKIVPNPEIKKYGSKNCYTDNDLYMNGPEIYNFTIKNIPLLVQETLNRNSIGMDDLSYIIFHQANKYMLQYLRKKIKAPEDKFYVNMENVGNTVSNTIPIALKDSLENEFIKKGDKVLLAGFGVGYSWAGTVIEI